MSVTNLAVGQQISLIGILNTKLEKPVRTSEMGLDVVASTPGQAVRWDEFSSKHNNDGSFKVGIIAQPQMKTKSVVALADVSATPTATQMIDSGIFTITPTAARTLTTDTAVNLIADISGYQVGTYFEFTIVNNAAFDVTLVAGTGVTLVGKAVINNVSGTWLARIDSSTGITMYRE